MRSLGFFAWGHSPPLLPPTLHSNTHSSCSRKIQLYNLETAEDRNQGDRIAINLVGEILKAPEVQKEWDPNPWLPLKYTHRRGDMKGFKVKQAKIRGEQALKTLIRYVSLLLFRLMAFPEQSRVRAAESWGFTTRVSEDRAHGWERSCNLRRKLRKEKKKKKMHWEVRPIILVSTLPKFLVTATMFPQK